MPNSQRTTSSRAHDRGRARALIIALFGLLCAAFAGNAHALTACPASVMEVDYYQGTPFTTQALVFDTTLDMITVVAHLTINHPQAATFLSATSSGGCHANVRTIERLDVSGVPIGTHVDATLRLHLNGSGQQNCGGSGCGLQCEQTLVAGGDSTTCTTLNGMYIQRTLITSLFRPVTFVAGSPIEVQFYLAHHTGPGGSASSQMNAHYEVIGLPPGVHVVACSGDDITPVRDASWGALKVRYR